MVKKVIFSTNSNINYSVYAPITTLVWQKITGYKPVIILVVDELNKPTEFAIEEARKLGAEIHEIKAVPTCYIGTSSQVSRIFVGCLDMNPDDYCLTSDIDMWALNRDYFHQQDWSKDVHIFFSDANSHKTYPICYLGMKHKTWQEVMQVKIGNITDSMSNQMNQDLGPDYNSTKQWMYDEYLFETRLRHWHGYKTRCQMMHRGLNRNGGVNARLDRGSWNWNGDLAGLVDSHVLRPMYFQNNWERLERLLRSLLNNDDYAYCINYNQQMLHHTQGMF